jgi:hypothetical protein
MGDRLLAMASKKAVRRSFDFLVQGRYECNPDLQSKAEVQGE